MRRYRYAAHTKSDLKVHLIWVPKYRKKVLVGPVAVRVRDLIRQIATEHELTILSGKVARDHVHVFVSYRPHQDISTIVQWLKGISSRVLLQEFAVSSGTITDEMVEQYIAEQEGEPLHDDSQFPIDSQ